MYGALFVPAEYKFYGSVVDLMEYWDYNSAGIAEHVLDLFLYEGFDYDLGTFNLQVNSPVWQNQCKVNNGNICIGY